MPVFRRPRSRGSYSAKPIRERRSKIWGMEPGSGCRQVRRRKGRQGFLFGVVLLQGILSGAPAAGEPGKTPYLAEASQQGQGQALALAVRSLERAAKRVGVQVVELASDTEVVGRATSEWFLLASNTKLFTTAAALLDLGSEFEYETVLLRRGGIAGRVLEGDLGVVGAADPNLSGRFYDGDSLAPFRPWARALIHEGVREVAGDLWLFNGIFEGPRTHPDWPPDQYATWYGAPVDALSFNDNCVLVRVRPGRNPGDRARIFLEPKLRYFAVRNSAATVSGQGNRLAVTRERESDTLVVSGTVGQHGGGLDVWVAVYDPNRYFGEALRLAFAEEGVQLRGQIRVGHTEDLASWSPVAVHRSPLSRTLEVTNKRSQNFYAEMLAKLLGYRMTGRGSWEQAVQAIRGVLSPLGVPMDELELADGSGLSRANRSTPRAVTSLLVAMYRHPLGATFLRSLPASGEKGLRWERRLATPPYRGNVLAKTGSLRGVSTLSGFAKARSGKVYAFSLLLNDVVSSGRAAQAQDEFLRALIDKG